MSNIDNFLLGGGGASAKFETVGDTVAGTIQSAEVQQQTDIGSGAGLTWDNGDPKQQLVVTLQTDQRDPSVEDDDGIRRVYVKGSKKPGSKSLHDAVAGAVRAAGAKGLEVGGRLQVTYTGDEPSQTRGFSPRKLYTATYAAPDKAAATADYLGAAPAPAAPAAPAPAAPAPQASPATGPTPEELAAFQQWQQSQQSA